MISTNMQGMLFTLDASSILWVKKLLSTDIMNT